MSILFGATKRESKPAISQRLLLSSCALIALAASAGTANAQVTDLEGIVVESANRTPTEASKVGSSVSVITEKDIEAQSKTYVKDYLEQVTGVNMTQTGPAGSQTGITIRGANQSYVKVLVDGMDLSDPSGTQVATRFENLLVGDVSRIEVLKGPQSTLYGGDAVAGVISIQTKGASTLGFSQSGGAEYGRYNTYRGAYTAGYLAEDGSNIAMTIQGVDTEGFSARSFNSEDDAYHNVTISGRGEVFVSKDVSIFFAARTLDARNDYDNNPNPFVHGDTVQHAGRVGTNISLLNGRFQNTFAFQGMTLERDDRDEVAPGPFNISWYDSDRIKGEYKGLYTFTDSVSVLFGADWERSGIEFFNFGPFDRVTTEVAGYYAQLMVEPIDGLLLTGGGRIDDHDAFGQFETYRLTAAYNIPGTESILRGSYGTGFRAPSLYEQFGLGNADLGPETSKGWDIGFEQGFLQGRFKIGATYFELDTEDLIEYVPFPPPNPPWGMYQNVAGVTQRHGVELFAAAVLTPEVTVTTGYTYTDTETEAGDRLARVPKHVFVASLDAQPFDKVSLNITGRYLKDNLDTIFGVGLVPVDDHFLLSAKLGYEFTPGWTAYVRGENLLDEDYETAVGYNNPGLAVYGGFSFALPEN